MNIHSPVTAANRKRFLDVAAAASERAFHAVVRAHMAADASKPELAKFRIELARADFDLACRYLEKLAA